MSSQIVGTRRWRAARARLGDTDTGTTLMELIVGMAIMTVFMSIFLTSILLMTSTANKVEATSIAANQTTQAFLRLDKTVRYADAISTPAVSTTSGYWYVEFSTPVSGAADQCTQLRVNTGKKQLEQRTWTVGQTTPTPSFTPIASFVTNGTSGLPSAAPFVLLTSSSTSFEQLQVTLIATATGSSTATNTARVTFSAVNSDASQSSNATTCQQWGRP